MKVRLGDDELALHGVLPFELQDCHESLLRHLDGANHLGASLLAFRLLLKQLAAMPKPDRSKVRDISDAT